MTRISQPDTLDSHRWRDDKKVKVKVTMPLLGGPTGPEDSTDSIWRQLYDEAAVEDGIPARAHGSDNTYIVVTFSGEESDDQVKRALTQAAELVASTDGARAEYSEPADRIVASIAGWWESYKRETPGR